MDSHFTSCKRNILKKWKNWIGTQIGYRRFECEALISLFVVCECRYFEEWGEEAACVHAYTLEENIRVKIAHDVLYLFIFQVQLLRAIPLVQNIVFLSTLCINIKRSMSDSCIH